MTDGALHDLLQLSPRPAHKTHSLRSISLRARFRFPIFGLDDGPAKSVVVSFSSILYHPVDTHLCHSLEGSKVRFFEYQHAFSYVCWVDVYYRCSSLVFYALRERAFKTYDSQDGMLSDALCSMYETFSSRLWMSCLYSLYGFC